MAERLLSLLSLLQTPREWPGSELARRLGVSLRTIRRDVDRLRELGYPVQATMGAVGGYRLVAGKAMPPLLLEDDEAVAIAVGLRTAAGHAVEGIEEASVRALAKLEQVLPSRLRHRVGTLSAATVPMLTWDRPTVDPDTLTVLAAAIANRERLRFRYRGSAPGPARSVPRSAATRAVRAGHPGPPASEASAASTAPGGAASTDPERLVEPHRLVSAGRRWYLVAYDNDRDDWRIFRVDRIGEPRPTGVRTAPRPLPAEDAAAYVTQRLYELAPVYRAVATLHAPLAQVAGRVGDSPGDLEAVDEHTCRLHGHTDTLQWLAFRLVTLGCEFEVHEPPELIEHLRRMGARITRALPA